MASFAFDDEHLRKDKIINSKHAKGQPKPHEDTLFFDEVFFSAAHLPQAAIMSNATIAKSVLSFMQCLAISFIESSTPATWNAMLFRTCIARTVNDTWL